MDTTKFIIKESGLKEEVSKKFIIKMINHQINNCKLDYVTEWERDHSITTESKDEKIEILENKKKKFEAFFDNCQSLNPATNFNIAIEINMDHS